MKTIERNTIFTNVLSRRMEMFGGKGLAIDAPKKLISWLGTCPGIRLAKSRLPIRTPASPSLPKQCPIYSPAAEDPKEFPFRPLFLAADAQCRAACHGSVRLEPRVFLGASISSETTAAAKGEIGKLRHDPFAMLPFCGYNMGDYFAHWIEMGRRLKKGPSHLCGQLVPHRRRRTIFMARLWRKYSGFKMDLRASNDHGLSISSPIGYLPAPDSIDRTNLSIPMEPLFTVDRAEWQREAQELERYFQLFGSSFSISFGKKLYDLKQRINRVSGKLDQPV